MKRILFIATILLIAYSGSGQNTIMHQGKIGMQYTVSGTQKNLLMDFTADSTRFVIGNTWYTFDKSIALRPNKIIKTGTDTLSTKAYVRSKMTTASSYSVLARFYSDASTSGTGLTSLYSYTIAANTLAANGDVIEANYTLTSSVVGTFTIALGGNSYTSAEMDWSSTSPVNVSVHIMRVSSSAARVSINASMGNTTVNTQYFSWTGYTFSNTIDLILKATSPYTGSITAKFGYIKKL